MRRFMLVGVLGLGTMLAFEQQAQAYWIHVPHQHFHHHKYSGQPVVPLAPAAPFYGPSYAPITPGQIVAGAQLIWNGFQWVNGILGHSLLPWNITLPPGQNTPVQTTSKPVDPSVVTSINKSDATIKETIDLMNGVQKPDGTKTLNLLDLVAQGDDRLKNLPRIPSLATSGTGGTGGGTGTVVTTPPQPGN